MGSAKRILLTVSAGVAGLLVLGFMVPRNDVGSDRKALIEKRVQFRQNLSKSPPLDIPIIDCASDKISDQTVETLQLLFINKRGDLTRAPDRDSAVKDMIFAYQQCGATDAQILGTARSDEENLMSQGLAIAALMKGRGLRN